MVNLKGLKPGTEIMLKNGMIFKYKEYSKQSENDDFPYKFVPDMNSSSLGDAVFLTEIGTFWRGGIPESVWDCLKIISKSSQELPLQSELDLQILSTIL